MRPLLRVFAFAVVIIALVFPVAKESMGKGNQPKADDSSVDLKSFKVPVPKMETLPNGLRVAWFYSDRLPVVDFAMLVESGYRDDLPGKSGTAQILSQILDRGAKGASAIEMAKQIEKLGASRYQSADDDTFSVGVHGLSIDADKLLPILSSIVLSPNLTEKEFESERGKVIDQIEHVGDYASTLANMAYFRAVSNKSSYARGSIHSVGELKKLKHEDVKSYFSTHFTPKNAILMIVGRYDEDEIRSSIEKHFGNWQGKAPKRAWKDYELSKIFKPNKSALRPVVWLVDRKGVSQAEIRMGFKGPSIKSGDYYSLSVVNALFGEVFNSRLNRSIRDEMGLVYSIGSTFNYSRDISRFTISTACEQKMTTKVLKKLISLLNGLRTESVTHQEVSTAKDYLLGSFPVTNSTLGAVASRWLAGVVYDMGSDYLNEYLPKVAAVTHADVIKAVRTHIVTNRLIVVIAGDEKLLKPQLQKAGFNIRSVTAQDLF